MMVCVFCALLLSVLLRVTTSTVFTSALDVSAGAESASPCPARWHLFGQRCFAFYPVWSSWSTAEFLCSQTGSNLVSLHTPEETLFVHQITNTQNPLWVGGYQVLQSHYWLWSDGSPSRYSHWANQWTGSPGEGGACMEMKSGELSSAPCGELKFFVCSTKASFSPKVLPSNRKPADPGMVPGVSLWDVLWGRSESVAEEILRSSSLLRALRSGRLTESCYSAFIQQEALYLQRVSSTLQALIGNVKESDNVRALLLDTHKHYSSTNQSLLDVPPPQWLVLSLQSFHSVVLEDLVYWLVALSARAHLRSFLQRELLPAASPERSPIAGMSSNSSPRLISSPRPETEEHAPEKGQGLLSKAGPVWEPDPGQRQNSGPRLVSGPETSSLYQQWSRDGLEEAVWARRYRETIEEYQQQMDVFKAINIFREHMINQKSLYKAVSCDAEDGADEEEGPQVKGR